MYYVLLDAGIDRQAVIEAMKRQGVNPVFHYVPLHDSPGGRRYGRVVGDMAVTQTAAARLLRLPLWIGLGESQQQRVVAVLADAIAEAASGLA